MVSVGDQTPRFFGLQPDSYCLTRERKEEEVKDRPSGGSSDQVLADSGDYNPKQDTDCDRPVVGTRLHSSGLLLASRHESDKPTDKFCFTLGEPVERHDVKIFDTKWPGRTRLLRMLALYQALL